MGISTEEFSQRFTIFQNLNRPALFVGQAEFGVDAQCVVNRRRQVFRADRAISRITGFLVRIPVGNITRGLATFLVP